MHFQLFNSAVGIVGGDQEQAYQGLHWISPFAVDDPSSLTAGMRRYFQCLCFGERHGMPSPLYLFIGQQKLSASLSDPTRYDSIHVPPRRLRGEVTFLSLSTLQKEIYACIDSDIEVLDYK